MVKSLFIFGNGLGRSISNEFFDLKPALQNAWDAVGVLTKHQKDLITRCLPSDVFEDEEGEAPKKEDQLEELQRILSACDTIASVERRDASDDAPLWLSSEGREFPTAIRRYLHQAACYFLDRQDLYSDGGTYQLDDEFAETLRQYIREHGAHIVTLNYDDLLYDVFCETDIFAEYLLRDGFFKAGKFDFDLAERLYLPSKQGWFLHLHGSPLFINSSGEPLKVKRAALQNYLGNESTHLVLTSVKFKRSIIQSSEVLRRYWKKLETLVPKSSNIVLFGYGGADVHLNELLAQKAPEQSIRVVEYKGTFSMDLKRKHWEKALDRKDFKVIELDNLQSFVDWKI